MPTYQYACTECGHEFETVQSFSDASLTECPQCTGKLRKVFNAVGIVFKGSGFYRTDSRSGSAAKDSSPDSAGSKAAAGATTDGGSSTSGSSASGATRTGTAGGSSAGSTGTSSTSGASTSASSSTKGSAA